MSNSPAPAVLEKKPDCESTVGTTPAAPTGLWVVRVRCTASSLQDKKSEFTAKDNIIMCSLVAIYAVITGLLNAPSMGLSWDYSPQITPSQTEAVTIVVLMGVSLALLNWSFDCFRRSRRNLLKGAIGGCIGRLFVALMVLWVGSDAGLYAMNMYTMSTSPNGGFSMAGCS